MKSPAEIQKLADLCEERGDYLNAAKLHDRALRLAEQEFGSTSPELESYLYNCAMIACALDEIERSRTMFRRLLSIKADPELKREVPQLLAAMEADAPRAVNS